MTNGGPEPSAAERQPLDAVRHGVVCFAAGAAATPGDMATWGPERTISAAALRELLLPDGTGQPSRGVRLRGAVIEGPLDLKSLEVPDLRLDACRVGSVTAKGATFTGSS